MTSQITYFGDIFPAALVLRLTHGGSTHRTTRHLAVSRPTRFWRHFSAAFFDTPGDLANLLLFTHCEDEKTGKAVKAEPGKLWYCTTLHLGWALIEHIPLVKNLAARDDRHLDKKTFEVVIDLDLPDVEKRPRNALFPIRGGFLCQCATKEKGCCQRCWMLLRLAKRALSLIIPACWGPALWLYSGGKGAHCLFGSEEARSLPLELRQRFLDGMEGVISGEERPPNAFVDALRAAWEEIGVREAKVLASNDACLILANAFLVQGSTDHAKFIKGLTLTSDSAQRWSMFLRIGGNGLGGRVACELGLLTIDAGPLTRRDGQIKCPFSLHMKTRNVALPLTDDQFERFDPANAVSVRMEPRVMRLQMKDSITHFAQWLDTNKYT